MLGENIKLARESKGMSQQQLADRLHVVRQTVSKWENNLSVPDADLLKEISVILGVDINFLLDDNQTYEKEECKEESFFMQKLLKIILVIGIVILGAMLAFIVCNILQTNVGINESVTNVFVKPI